MSKNLTTAQVQSFGAMVKRAYQDDKSRRTIEALIFEGPAVADWWIRMESLGIGEDGSATFRKDRPTYAQMRVAVERQGFFDFGDEDGIDCFCTD